MDAHKLMCVSKKFYSKILLNSSNFKLLCYLIAAFTLTEHELVDDTNSTILSV